ncbi:MAG: glycosyltransferase [SAR324 cluster bacterium]|uniref:Glycosyltransferase n=1 Tax=SAR324 cluster bacterium TaxID=2024889 RepID=A0A7X9FQF7_9DELT|nr:glycosyltransferase [SAR324 cluster bacterium]
MIFEVLHPFSVDAGFGKRFMMIMEVLSESHELYWTRRILDLPEAIIRILRSQDPTILIYTSVISPTVVLLKALRPNLRINYMVRGDEWGEFIYQGRRLRAWFALFGQRLLRTAGVRFVFVSWDLKDRIEARIGDTTHVILPNTLGHSISQIKVFDGRIGLVGDFASVKNIEYVLEELSKTTWECHLFGNRTLPETWNNRNIISHGMVDDLVAELKENCSLVVFSSLSEGFPNVLLEALEAGCSVLVHDSYPFQQLPISKFWRYNLEPGSLRNRLQQLIDEPRDFLRDNREFMELVAKDWAATVKAAFLC